jgi:predicted  nucleic acid-binding Zn-ribbon protein
LDEARQDLQHSKTRLRSLREKVESLQEALRRHKDRIDPKLEKVRALGTRWANAQNVQEREAIEQRERRLQSSLSGLIEVAHEVNERSRSAEKEKHELEDELINLLKIVGDDTSLYDQF